MYGNALAFSGMFFIPSHVDEALKEQGQFFLIEIPN
jgi:hypothetical protein